MGKRCMQRAKRQHTSKAMVGGYRKLMRSVVKRRVLVDMDGVLVDWDRGFLDAWGDRSPVDRSDYYIQGASLTRIAKTQKSCFALRAFQESAAHEGRNLSAAQNGRQRIRCVNMHVSSHSVAILRAGKVGASASTLGDAFLPRVILTRDKTAVMGDVLIDDKPQVTGKYAPSWSHIIFDAPYNREVSRRWEGANDELGIMGKCAGGCSNERGG